MPQDGFQATTEEEASNDAIVYTPSASPADMPVPSAILSPPSSSLPTPRNLSETPGQYSSEHPIVAEVLALPPDNMLHVVAVDHEYQAKADKWTSLFSLDVYQSLIERSPLQGTAKTKQLFSGELMSYWDAVEGSGPGGKGGWETYRRFDQLETKAVEQKRRMRYEPTWGIGSVHRCLLLRREQRRRELLGTRVLSVFRPRLFPHRLFLTIILTEADLMGLRHCREYLLEFSTDVPRSLSSVVDQLWTDYLAWEHANGIEDEARIRARLGRLPLSDFPTLLQRNQAEREALWEQAGEKQ